MKTIQYVQWRCVCVGGGGVLPQYHPLARFPQFISSVTGKYTWPRGLRGSSGRFSPTARCVRVHGRVGWRRLQSRARFWQSAARRGGEGWVASFVGPRAIPVPD